MEKIGIEIDYSNICKDYNTSYLDRDNLDPNSSKCMKEVLAWTREFLFEFLKKFEYSLYNLHSSTSVKIDDIASKRFLFYSLEKEITLQNYVMRKEYIRYDSLKDWELKNDNSILIRNDADGGGIYFFFHKDSTEHQWIKETLRDFDLDEIPFEAK